MEVDSYKYHRHQGAFGRDRRRDQLLTVARWKHVRFIDDEINRESAHVAEVVRRLLGL